MAYIAGRLNAIFGAGTATYAEVGDMAYDEFSAWCAFLAHREFHRDDEVEQGKHDDLMEALARAARG